jgi:hypothetical protein
MALDGSAYAALPEPDDVLPPDVLPLEVLPPDELPPATLNVVLTTGHTPLLVQAL